MSLGTRAIVLELGLGLEFRAKRRGHWVDI